jgi:hypothetical protein
MEALATGSSSKVEKISSIFVPSDRSSSATARCEGNGGT